VKKVIFLAGSSMVIIALMAGFACAATEPIKIGYISNIRQPYGKSGTVAVQIAVDEINNGGGISGKPVKLIIEDNKGEVPLTAAAYKKLVLTDGCLVVFTEGSTHTLAGQEIGLKNTPIFKSESGRHRMTLLKGY
jgi:branched-chain amino acid transport system substrate-binding protein